MPLSKREEKLPTIVLKKCEEVESFFKWLYNSISIIWSFSTWEFTLKSNGTYLSDVDLYIILKPWADINEAYLLQKKAYNILNKNIEKEPRTSIRIVPCDEFYSTAPEDTLIPYQIRETKTTIFWNINQNRIYSKKIEFNSHIWLCGVAYMQLLKWLNSSDTVSLSKWLFNIIWCFLISKEQYTTSYYLRIKRLIALFPEYKWIENDLYAMYKIKLTADKGHFIENIWTIDNFLEKFWMFFSLDMLNKIFQKTYLLNELVERITKDDDTHKYIRAAYITYYFKEYETCKALINIVKRKLGITYNINDKLSLDTILEAHDARLKTIGIYD